MKDISTLKGTKLIHMDKIPEPIIIYRYKCHVCGCAFNDTDSYKNHYKEHQRTGMPFVVSISLPPYEE